MRQRVAPGLLAVSIALVGVAGCEVEELSEEDNPFYDLQNRPMELINPRLLRRFQKAPEQEASPVTAQQVELGRKLWFETRLSKSHEISCDSCHSLENYGVDGLAASVGHNGAQGNRNAPTVYNAFGHVAMFWDGRAADLEEQAVGPILNPGEMAQTEEGVLETLRSIPEYVSWFDGAFPDDDPAIKLENVGTAIAAFERGLETTSRWDQYLGGDKSALTELEKRGLRAFINIGCVECHTGPQVGGSMLQIVGARHPWPNQSDVGRVGVTGDEADRMVFKVPTLKNIAKTAPYFHDGSAQTLPEAIRLMAWHQLGLELEPNKVESIAAFLGAFTGQLPGEYIRRPALPRSGPTTPSARL